MGHSMTQTTARNSLSIFWKGEERDGILVYGFWPKRSASEPRFPEEVWPEPTKWKSMRLEGEGWSVYLWEICISVWPHANEWTKTLRETLQALIAAGAEVAWCGIEGYFADPPSLFDPSEMSGGVWALLESDGTLHGPPDLDLPFATLPDGVLVQVRNRLGMPHGSVP
jgi:hypothetical protein